MTDSMISGSRRCTESYVKVWLPSEAASAGGSGLSDGIRHTTWLRERGITSAALLPASTTSAASIGVPCTRGGKADVAKLNLNRLPSTHA